MHLTGLGTDIIEIERIRRLVKSYGQRFLDKIFTHEELSYCLRHKDPAPSLAGRFAAKEAIVKALGLGFRDIGWKDIAIERDSLGRPTAVFSSQLAGRFSHLQLLVSISHCRSYATAVAYAQLKSSV